MLQAVFIFKHYTILRVLMTLHFQSVGTRLVTEPTRTNKFERDSHCFNMILVPLCFMFQAFWLVSVQKGPHTVKLS